MCCKFRSPAKTPLHTSVDCRANNSYTLSTRYKDMLLCFTVGWLVYRQFTSSAGVFSQRVDFHHGCVQLTEHLVEFCKLIHGLRMEVTFKSKQGGNFTRLLLCETLRESGEEGLKVMRYLCLVCLLW